MDAEAAKEIIERGRDHGTMDYRNAVFKGMKLIMEVMGDDYDLPMSAEHDQIWVGDFDNIVVKMTEEQVEQMASWAWFEDLDAWSRFV